MSGRQAKAARRNDRLKEQLFQAHDRLHKEDVEGCHAVLHGALGLGEEVTDVAPLSQRAAFDEEFRKLCVRHQIQASYVAVDSVQDGVGRMIAGGDAYLCSLLKQAAPSFTETKSA